MSADSGYVPQRDSPSRPSLLQRAPNSTYAAANWWPGSRKCALPSEFLPSQVAPPRRNGYVTPKGSPGRFPRNRCHILDMSRRTRRFLRGPLPGARHVPARSSKGTDIPRRASSSPNESLEPSGTLGRLGAHGPACSGLRRCLFLRPDPQRLHFAIEVAALQAEQFGGAGDVAVGLFELLEDVLALGGFADFLQAAEAVQRAVGAGGGRR